MFTSFLSGLELVSFSFFLNTISYICMAADDYETFAHGLPRLILHTVVFLSLILWISTNRLRILSGPSPFLVLWHHQVAKDLTAPPEQ